AGVSVRAERRGHADRRSRRAAGAAYADGRSRGEADCRRRGGGVSVMITLDRGSVERLVRDALKKQLGEPSSVKSRLNPLVVNVSARHAHVTQEDLERLFGKGHQLTPFKWLYQDGFFAAEEMVTIICPR